MGLSSHESMQAAVLLVTSSPVRSPVQFFADDLGPAPLLRLIALTVP